MLGYLQKFNSLPDDLRQKVSDAKAMEKIEALEKKYNIALAALIMKVMVKEIALDDLPGYLFKENLSKEQSEELALELRQGIFSSLRDYFLAGKIKPVAPILTGMPAMDAPPISESKVKGASFFFSTDDEEEIRNLTEKIIVAENSGVASGTVDDKLKEIISRVEINFGSADLADRFSKILRTYLCGIRNMLGVKATLMKPFLSGGLNFDEDSAEKVMLLANKVLNSSSSQAGKPLLKINLPEFKKTDLPPKPEISRDAAYDFSKFEKRDDRIKNDLKKLDTGHELAPLTPAVISVPITQKNAPKIKEKIVKIKPIPPPPVNDAGTMPLIKRRFEAENLNQSQKAKIEDVKYVPRVMGPLDEIKFMDLINFRRLDRDPFRSADKIKNKINLLEEENYGKKFEGINLWRQSPINKLYLEIGSISIRENKPVDVIIEERKMAGLDYLTADEFKTIMDLNKSLRF